MFFLNKLNRLVVTGWSFEILQGHSFNFHGHFELFRLSFEENVVSDQVFNFQRQALDHANEESIHFRRHNCQFIFQHSIDDDISRFIGCYGWESIDRIENMEL